MSEFILNKEFRKFDERFPNVGFPSIELKKTGKAFVSLEAGEFLEVPYNIARVILFALKIKEKENRIGFSNMDEKEYFKKLRKIIELSNCHRALLFTLGFSFDDLRDNDSSSDIVENFFMGQGDISAQRINVQNIELEIKQRKKSKFCC